jgi:phage tail-like protein
MPYEPSPQASTYLQYLPAPYQSQPADSFISRFLLIVESMLGPIESMIDNLPYYFDPRLAPPELLPRLAAWVGLELDENWSLEQQRELVAQATMLYRWRGTRRGLLEHLRLYTGRTPVVVERFGSQSISVTVTPARPEHFDPSVARRIIEFQKPAHVAYILDVAADSS